MQGTFYGWWLVGTAAIALGFCSVPFNQGITAWFVVLHRHFPLWTRGQMSWAFAATRVEGGLIGPVEGILIDRFGSRRMVLTGMMILGSGFLLFSQINELWHLYGVFLVMSLGSGLGIWLPMMTAINNWFIRRRSLAMGLAAGGQAVGGILVVPALVWAIDPRCGPHWLEGHSRGHRRGDLTAVLSSLPHGPQPARGIRPASGRG